MEPESKISSRKQLIQGLWILLILLLAFSFFTPRFIVYADNGFVRAIPGIINLIAVPVLVITALTLSKGKFKFFFILLGLLARTYAYLLAGFYPPHLNRRRRRTKNLQPLTSFWYFYLTLSHL